MKKILFLNIVLLSFLFLPQTTHASDYIESVKNYANDIYIRRYKNDYDYYVLEGHTYLHYENTTGISSLTYNLCFFNKDTTVNVSNIFYIKTCPKLVRINLDISKDKSERFSSYESTGMFSGAPLLTNYYDKEDSNSSSGSSSIVDLEEIKPYFVCIIMLLIAMFFVLILVKAMGW